MPAREVLDIQARLRAPVDLLKWSTRRDPELSDAAQPTALTVAESLLIVHDGEVRVAFDRQQVRGHVLASSARRHLDDAVLSEPPALDLTGTLVTDAWLTRWEPASVVSLPLVVDGRSFGTLLALTYARPCDSDGLASLRACAERAALRLALRETKGQLRIAALALDATPVPAAGLDAGGRIRVWNEVAERTYAMPATEVLGRHLSDMIRTQAVTDDLAWQESRNSQITPVHVTSVSRRGETGISFSDRTPEFIAADELAYQQALSVMLLESVPGRACVLNSDGIVVATNAAFDAEGPLGRGKRSALPPGSDYLSWLAGVDEELHRTMVDVLDGDVDSMSSELETTYRRRQRWTELHATSADRPDAAALVLHIDITERKETELDLEHRATHDPLTGLPNRVLLVDRLIHALARAARSHAHVGILYCDLDGFKEINTEFGHTGGDQLLVEVGKRLRQVCRTSDTVARVSGDEFVLLLEDVSGASEMEEVAARILLSLSTPVALDSAVAHTGASIGMVLTRGIPRAGMGSVQKLVREVDAAMYAAKDAGRNQFAWFSPEMLERQQARPNFLEAMARRLLNR
ncbi:MAG: diguanylate cyclase [Candidatus Nanopelagicales bacterium]